MKHRPLLLKADILSHGTTKHVHHIVAGTAKHDFILMTLNPKP